MAKDYRDSLNLPATSFSMKANLTQREPETLKYWDSINLYDKMQETREGSPLYVIHDGPPFSNGNIHMGTSLNKLLKDFINKSKTMEGYKVPFVPGWDNHGMPIESAIIKKNKIDRKKMSVSEFRSACHEFAQNFVNIQRDQFIRLGVTADWEHPYLTMSHEFEAREVKVFGEMFKKGYIYKGLKPVYWCPKDETALAEAEIEYSTDKCTSVYVKFPVIDDKGVFAGKCDLSKTFFVIWTTTIWTLPGNMAIALSPTDNYALVKAGEEYYIVAEALCEKTMKAANIEDYEIVALATGKELEFARTHHPFLDRESVVLNADYVTMDSGTGCVHTAPGFGADDYATCRRYNIDLIVPVDDRGYQTEDAGKYAGMFYAESNDAIFNDMKEDGSLFAFEHIEHEYPHCWRCKNPIIFRATPQWFCSVESFKEEACRACDDVNWIPEWGKDRMIQMIRERADWCISRQRHWGLPIPVFYCEDCGKPICTDESINAVSDAFGKFGSNAWFDMESSEILPEGFVCPHCGGKHFTKDTNTLDGWFDSGSSHYAVLDEREELKWPADIYLEGADQYRGWFQSSLLTAVGAKGQGAPYRNILTHGWTVDGEGRAMHKSLGNSVSPDEMIKKYGADLVRLWAASSDYHADVRCSDNIFKQLSETYRKIRNTARIIMANLNGFDPDRDMCDASELLDIDKWILSRMNEVSKTCRNAYDSFEFHIVYHALNKFCTIDLSKLYIDITKDRVYVEKSDSKERRSAQTAMYLILNDMTKILAPLASFTAEEIWQAMPHSSADAKESVFLNLLPEYREDRVFADIRARYDRLFDLRDDVMKALELARAEKTIGKSLDAKVEIFTKDEGVSKLLNSFGDELKTVFITSGVSVNNTDAPEGTFNETESGISVLVSKADGCKCGRCWGFYTVGHGEGEDFLCDRCFDIVESIL